MILIYIYIFWTALHHISSCYTHSFRSMVIPPVCKARILKVQSPLTTRNWLSQFPTIRGRLAYSQAYRVCSFPWPPPLESVHKNVDFPVSVQRVRQWYSLNVSCRSIPLKQASSVCWEEKNHKKKSYLINKTKTNKTKNKHKTKTVVSMN